MRQGLVGCRDLQALAAWVGYRDLQATAEGKGACVLFSKSVWDSEPVRLALKVVESRKKISVVYGFLFFLFKIKYEYLQIHVHIYSI